MLEAGEVAAAIVLVPSEHVLMIAAELPLASHRRRIEALPFAIEDRLAEPLDAAHVVLGGALGPRRYLAGVVRHEQMREWMAVLESAAMGHAALVPDALALPLPSAGRWSVDLAGGRAVVRTDDGGGFAIPETQLRSAWAAAGKPSCTAFGDRLPPELAGDPPADMADAALEPLASRLVSPPLNLRQGRYAARRVALSPLRRRVAIVAASGLLAHGAIAAAETVALRAIAGEKEAETRSLLAIAAPGRPAGGDVIAAAAEMLPAGNAAPGRFLPLLASASGVLTSAGAELHALSFDDRQGTLALEVKAPEAAALERVVAALEKSGLPVQVGKATAEDDAIRALVTVRVSGGEASG